MPPAGPPDPISIAFVGNSITFVNDLPRFMEELSQNSITQDSCLHGGLSFLTLLTKGNGMYHKWKSEKALINTDNNIYDYGQCSVPQLLFGYDENLLVDDYYYNDGKNPCFRSNKYLNYLLETNTVPPQFDYLVMNDQTKYPGIYKRRRRSLLALQQVYAPIIEDIGVTPVFIATHGYTVNSTVLKDVPTFTSKIYYGYRKYAQALEAVLPSEQQPLIAPSGVAFLTVWEENPPLWEKLFFVDGFHPSPHGTYLQGCVLYATLYGEMPTGNRFHTKYLFRRARKMEVGRNGPTMPLPTRAEAQYLYRVAKRVVLQNHRPQSLLTDEEVEALEQYDERTWYTINGE